MQNVQQTYEFVKNYIWANRPYLFLSFFRIFQGNSANLWGNQEKIRIKFWRGRQSCSVRFGIFIRSDSKVIGHDELAGVSVAIRYRMAYTIRVAFESHFLHRDSCSVKGIRDECCSVRGIFHVCPGFPGVMGLWLQTGTGWSCDERGIETNGTVRGFRRSARGADARHGGVHGAVSGRAGASVADARNCCSRRSSPAMRSARNGNVTGCI